MNIRRLIILQGGRNKSGPAVYWMQRDQRVNDNWALIYAQQKAIEKNTPLIVIFNLVPGFLEATTRQYGFMIKGLQEVEQTLARYSIPFFLLNGNPVKNILKFIEKYNVSLLVTDFNPLKNILEWKQELFDKIDIPFHEVDAHNIVPCRVAANKQEYAAYTFRPKINKLLPEFMDEFPSIKKMKHAIKVKGTDWRSVQKSLKINSGVKEIDWLIPGEIAAQNVLQFFINNKFEKYGVNKNFPGSDVQSNLSPYFHFGQIAPQRVALTVQHLHGHAESQKTFLEEMIVRRELADNFCFYNPDYDSFEGFPRWAKDSLNLHRKDKREYIYSIEQFEKAETRDPLWNAAQIEMFTKGKMHGYMRMYWAKKILEWSKTPEEAIKTAIYLNDKYELDGRDPNGYTGIAWSIGGVHDRAWAERNTFGKIRYMNFAGCKRKFDVADYIKKQNADFYD